LRRTNLSIYWRIAFMSEFTKGKWEYKQGDGNYWTIQSVKTEQVGDCINEANARLIAAAPEMYEILDGLIYKLKANGADEREEIDEVIQEMESLLARIDGEDEEAQA